VAKYNPALAPMLYTSYNNYKSGITKQKDVAKIVGNYISEGKPEVPAQPEKPFQTTEEQEFGMPGLRGNVEQYAQPGQAAIPAKHDPEGLVKRLSQNPAYMKDAQEYANLYGVNKKQGGGAYGGIQVGLHPVTGKPVQYIVGEADFIPREVGTGKILKPGVDYEPTMAMSYQNVVGPGGVNQIVTAPTRGVPGKSPTTSQTGMMPDKNFTAETAGKLKMLDQGMSDAQRAKEMIFDEKGELKTGLLAKANVPFTSGIGGDARILYSAIKNAVASKYRGETGAAGNQAEVEDMTKRFMPSVLDTKESAADKLDRLEEFLGSAYDIVDPAKVYPRIAKPMKPRGPVKTPVGSTKAERVIPESGGRPAQQGGTLTEQQREALKKRYGL